ncbi:hypothetical protein CDL12_00098 [Handroanthus impetiginosus]|uniref:WRKY domain-containing protein n=1 Tax=Handroanthus impetiginosus TaxID=429701 RepID=A0A2G9IBJ1_9LAMI|nr:hypothetical protein CDL12_00098 [Handroanthus impetiginosus]
MENFPANGDMKNLVKELSEGRELAAQLQGHLNGQSSNSHQMREFLLHKILNSYDQALAVLKHGHAGTSGGGGGEAAAPGATAVGTSESPRSLVGSPPTDDSDQDFKDQASRKRKVVPSSTEKVKVNPATGIEGQLDDGYSWRKYGQKDILGAKYPRGYYRCTHRHGQGCLATKYVQRSDEDPNTYEITYRRTHTCNPRTNANNPPVSTLDPQNENPNPLPRSEQNQPPLNIQTSLGIITQDLGPSENPPLDPFINFPSSSRLINPQNSDNDNLVSNLEDYSNYFSILTDISNDNYGGLVSDLQINSESELSPVVAAVTSSSNSPTVGTSLPFGSSGSGSDFGFGDPGHYYN